MIADGLYGRNFRATLRLYLQTLALLAGIGALTAALVGYKASIIATPIAAVVVVLIQYRVATEAEARVPVQLSLWPDWARDQRQSILIEANTLTGREFWLADSERRFIRYVNNDKVDAGQRELMRTALRESLKSRVLVRSTLLLVAVSLAAIIAPDIRSVLPQSLSFVLGALIAAIAARLAQHELLHISTILPVIRHQRVIHREPTTPRRISHPRNRVVRKTAA